MVAAAAGAVGRHGPNVRDVKPDGKSRANSCNGGVEKVAEFGLDLRLDHEPSQTPCWEQQENEPFATTPRKTRLAPHKIGPGIFLLTLSLALR